MVISGLGAGRAALGLLGYCDVREGSPSSQEGTRLGPQQGHQPGWCDRICAREQKDSNTIVIYPVAACYKTEVTF